MAAGLDIDGAHRIAEQHYGKNEPGGTFADDLFGIAPRVVSGGSKIGKYNGGGPPEGDETKHHRRGDEHRNGGTLGLRVGHYSLYVRFCFRFRAFVTDWIGSAPFRHADWRPF